jgi:hypothetical protein
MNQSGDPRMLVKLFLSYFTLVTVAHAELDKQDEQALKETQQLMTNKEERTKAIQKDPKAQTADANLKALMGGNANATEEVYALAADVFANVMKEANGDVGKMQEMMAKFMRDPAAFANSWTPEQKAKLKLLAEKIGRPEMAPKK